MTIGILIINYMFCTIITHNIGTTSKSNVMIFNKIA